MTIISQQIANAGRELASAGDDTIYGYFYHLGRNFRPNPDAQTFQAHWAQIARSDFDNIKLVTTLQRTHSVMGNLFRQRDSAAQTVLQFLSEPQGMPVWYKKATEKFDKFTPEDFSLSLDTIKNLSAISVMADADFVARAAEKFALQFEDFGPIDFASLLSIAQLVDHGIEIDLAPFVEVIKAAIPGLNEFKSNQISRTLRAVAIFSRHGLEPDMDFIEATKSEIIQIAKTDEITPRTLKFIGYAYRTLAPVEPGTPLHALLYSPAVTSNGRDYNR